jgi:hypothetical protein
MANCLTAALYLFVNGVFEVSGEALDFLDLLLQITP